ncbi:MAG TPA: amidohydrolase family protein [Longimicrobiales bacterium]|nr:amidohydrolase family protein [Longimicrobiales bacterium]
MHPEILLRAPLRAGAALLTLALSAAFLPAPGSAQVYDVVLRGGRVMDPESGLDAMRDVGIRDGIVAAIAEGPLEGRDVVDVSGLVVAPGFIDLHAHGQDPFSADLQARDGVTTALELEGGVFPVTEWYGERNGGWRIHYGATVSHGAVRGRVFDGDREAAVYRPPTPEQVREMQDLVERGLAEGAIGVGFGIQYVPGASREEIYRIIRTAGEHGVTSFVHVRYAGLVEPESSIAAVQEMIADAAGADASVHIVHIGSSGLRQIPVLLDMIGTARAAGIDVSTEVYPYTAASTGIESAIFDPGWRERLGADYGDIEWVATGERLDSASFVRHREEGGPIIAHVIPQEEMEEAVAHPDVMIASDGVPFVNGRAHPRGAGTFARVLGRYVREQGTLGLMDALRKMTLMPARRLQGAIPEMRRKGRVAVGADADLTVFDPERVIDRATFAEPAQPSAGIPHVLVGGTFVVRDGEIVGDARPGRAMRRRPIR